MLTVASAIESRRHETGIPSKGPIDRAYIARFTFGNADLEREILDLFAEHAPTYLLQLMAAETDRAWYEAAHTLKGSARAVGAREVAWQAERAEAMKVCRDGAERAALIDDLAAALDAARAYISELAHDR